MNSIQVIAQTELARHRSNDYAVLNKLKVAAVERNDYATANA